ncbi:conserved hypothetical protein [Leishmania infantum JPCM5]|uniref:Uncharacterized protein n=3 Tax=Leishmania donovani species complex TaxID=38574 RepID=A4HXM5_LEIIN|nr:conserved hypothetical protein [Leishmania infantum JPCM5]AYU77926.1 hypothetical protein LdCL_170022400 [Leishmania donovani]CAC9479161.1 hypothetical_protein_-_conserved [Leishmania infantum]AYU78692.1 hypothetical protein LdCL_210028400 [Leishmania donovani]TPP49438.1 hypothetical protein CGC21_34730 [Leishmania donovani]CAM59844.1 conserved hypothetical protein [Leishmania infantum JPCM5]|eukprot:XP_001464816.1 conserved hypothetical protein [Leishmania infantum JPCM5]
MEFFQVVDPVTLAPASYAYVALQLALAVACAVLLGVCLHVLPERLVRCCKTARPKVPREALAKAVTPASKLSVANKPSSSAAASATPSFSAAAPVGTAPKAQAKATAPAASAAVADSTLDDALEAFFDEEILLDEALLDATAPSALPEEETAPTNRTPGKPTRPPPKKTGDFSTALAAKMAKGLRIKACPASTASLPQAQSKPPERNDTAEKELEDALDAYMEEEQLLDEAMLDSAVDAAHRT